MKQHPLQFDDERTPIKKGKYNQWVVGATMLLLPVLIFLLTYVGQPTFLLFKKYKKWRSK
jgi:hypothetical protein